MTNAQCAFRAAAASDADTPSDVANRAEALFVWLQAQPNAGNAQTALLCAAGSGANADDFEEDLIRRAEEFLPVIAAHAPGNGTA